MSESFLFSEAIDRYVGGVNRESEVCESLREETRRLPEARMQCHRDLAALLSLLVRASNTRRALEIGTFTGRSAIAIASALPESGRLIACDLSAERTRVARRYFKKTGLEAKIDLRIAPARETLGNILREDGPGSIDFAFIDADKTAYDEYYEFCLELTRPGGMIVLDNMLWSGRVADKSNREADTKALRAMNEKIRTDPRVEACLLTVGDGVMLARKKKAEETKAKS
jgi:predicted O-methyltransferase YrrM